MSAASRIRSRRWRIAALGGLWVAIVACVVMVPGCFTNNCEADERFWGFKEGEGHLLDERTWESTPIEAEWLQFSHQRYWTFDLRLLGDREPSIILPYLSANPNPLKTGDNMVLSSGNIAEIVNARKGLVVLHNGTCADYYIRLVVQTAPAAAPLDAGSTTPPADAASD